MTDRAVPAMAVLLLAGGEGRRMGGAKPERRLGGRRLLDFALEAASTFGGPLALGVRREDQIEDRGAAAFVLDEPRIEGPIASLVAGLTWAGARQATYLLTLPCDAPFLPCDLPERLIGRIGGGEANVALPRSLGRLHPSCGLWRVIVRDRLPEYLGAGRRSLMGLAEHVGLVMEDWGAPERDPFFNVNTPEDLRTAETWLAQPHLE